MNDSIEFTPKEKFQISLYEDPDGLFRRAIGRLVWWLAPSLGLVAYSFYCGEISFGVLGYGLLVFRSVYQISKLKAGLLRTAAIFRKYEAQLQRKQDAA